MEMTSNRRKLLKKILAVVFAINIVFSRFIATHFSVAQNQLPSYESNGYAITAEAESPYATGLSYSFSSSYSSNSIANESVVSGDFASSEYNADSYSMLGAAASFHVFALETANLAHNTGNFAASDVYVNGDIGIRHTDDRKTCFYAANSYTGTLNCRTDLLVVNPDRYEIISTGETFLKDTYTGNTSKVEPSIKQTVYDNTDGFIDLNQEFARLTMVSQALSEMATSADADGNSVLNVNPQALSGSVNVLAEGTTYVNIDANLLNSLQNGFNINGLVFNDTVDKMDASYGFKNTNQKLVINVDMAGVRDFSQNFDLRVNGQNTWGSVRMLTTSEDSIY